MSRRIAPTLRLIMECVQDTPGLNLCEESEKRKAVKELITSKKKKIQVNRVTRATPAKIRMARRTIAIMMP